MWDRSPIGWSSLKAGFLLGGRNGFHIWWLCRLGKCKAWPRGLPLGARGKLRPLPFVAKQPCLGARYCVGIHDSDHQQPKYDLCPSGAFRLVLVRREHSIPSADEGASLGLCRRSGREVKGRNEGGRAWVGSSGQNTCWAWRGWWVTVYVGSCSCIGKKWVMMSF